MPDFISSYLQLSSALLSALSSAVGGLLVHYVCHLALSPAPLFLSGSVWHLLLLAFSHTSRTGWYLDESKG